MIENVEGNVVDISGDGWKVLAGSCLDRLKELEDNSIDAVVTDPPYELGFMGKSWDSSGIAFNVEVWAECLRVLKPGGHLLAFGGSRTWHRIAVAIEDAGFEVRDSIAWLYGSGFPKSLDVSKAIDKAAGIEREVIGQKITGNARTEEGWSGGQTFVDETAPATPEAQKWQGWGTALKPAFEPVVVARKPLTGTVAGNVLEWGVGGLNIDGTRIGFVNEADKSSAKPQGKTLKHKGWDTESWLEETKPPSDLGRWPSNVMLDEFTAELLDQQSGFSKSSGVINRWTDGAKPFGNGAGGAYESVQGVADSGGASRFFYVAKASKRDRNEGLDGLEEVEAKRTHSGGADTRGRPVPKNRNIHPTVKPTDLMRQLVRLVTPLGGTVLDPFTGSGSTGKAAILEGMQFIGCELTEDYLPIIQGRIDWAVEQVKQDKLKAEQEQAEVLF